MAIAIKDIGTLQNKYVARTGAASGDYKAGVMQPKASQSANAIAAAPLWQQAVSSAQAVARFKKNLAAAGDSAWQAGASGKGAARYSEGARLGAPKWSTNTQPYLSIISGITLPPKGIKGSDANIARVQAIATALHAAKVAKSA